MSDNEHDDGLPVRVTVRLSRLAAARLRDLADERGTMVSRVIRATLADTRWASKQLMSDTPLPSYASTWLAAQRAMEQTGMTEAELAALPLDEFARIVVTPSVKWRASGPDPRTARVLPDSVGAVSQVELACQVSLTGTPLRQQGIFRVTSVHAR